MVFAIQPGPKKIAAAVVLAGFDVSVRLGPVTDDLGKVFPHPSEVLLAVAVAGGESSGDALATHVNFPGSAQMSTDYGMWQINDMVNMSLFAGGGNAPISPITGFTWDWQNYCDNAWAAYKIYKEKGKILKLATGSFTPWMAYVGGGYKRVRWQKQTWMDWAQTGVNEAFAANKAGASWQQIASVSDDPLVTV